MRSVVGWNEYFMNIAETVATRSKDPNTQVGTVIVDINNHIIGTGYNGFAPGYEDTPDAWKSPGKYDIVIHAEVNALLHSSKSTKGAILYTTLAPCKECSKMIAAAGISKVYYRLYREDIMKTVDYLSLCGITTYIV